jgi:hypothetical protein
MLAAYLIAAPSLLVVSFVVFQGIVKKDLTSLFDIRTMYI